MADDRQLREFTCDPKFRKVLVTDGKTATGQALVKALAAAGADLIHAHSWFPAMAAPKDAPLVLTVYASDARHLRESRLARRLARPVCA